MITEQMKREMLEWMGYELPHVICKGEKYYYDLDYKNYPNPTKDLNFLFEVAEKLGWIHIQFSVIGDNLVQCLLHVQSKPYPYKGIGANQNEAMFLSETEAIKELK